MFALYRNQSRIGVTTVLLQQSVTILIDSLFSDPGTDTEVAEARTTVELQDTRNSVTVGTKGKEKLIYFVFI